MSSKEKNNDSQSPTPTPCLKISNIHFNININKSNKSKKFNLNKKFQTHKRIASSPNNNIINIKNSLKQQIDKEKQYQQHLLQNQSITLLRTTSFIPRTSNIKNSLFFVEKTPKRVQSLQSKKLQQRKFPMRKILARRSISGYSFFKQKKFSFGNPQTEPVFENKHILQSLSKSQTDFKSSCRLQSGKTNKNNPPQTASRSQTNMRYSQISQRLRYNQLKNRDQHLLLLKLDFS